MAGWEEYLVQHGNRFLDELLQFLRIPSISSLSEHRPDVQRAAEWLANRMKGAGIESVRVMPTGGQPVVYGEWLHAPDGPTVLIYGHFDVQPVDPLDLWDSPPFEPVIKDDRIYARGSTDDKGNLFIPLIVVEALLETTGKLPVNVKFLFEGQEEIGSPEIPKLMAENRDLLSCDLVLGADGGQWAEDQPALSLGTRGLIAVEVEVEGPDHDLHSGLYGGAIANPIHALAHIIDSMHDKDGRITVEGFYKRVRPLTDPERSQFGRAHFEEAQFLKATGTSSLFGEPGYTTNERAWARPTLEVNGIYGGFQGEGMKTVLPSKANAKISCRLVADQDPSAIGDLVLAHVKKVSPPGVRVRATRAEKGASPYLVPENHPGIKIAASVLRDVYGKEPYHTRTGGTIPINALFLEHLGAHVIIFGFALEDECQHSPNEFFRLSSFERGQKAYGMLLDRLGKGGTSLGL
jgi:acetylornithine deacetylase/succinyl-diaminopimelate desuccinylase-like protein